MARPSTRTKRQLKERRVLAAHAAGLDPEAISRRELVPLGQVKRMLRRAGVELSDEYTEEGEVNMAKEEQARDGYGWTDEARAQLDRGLRQMPSKFSAGFNSNDLPGPASKGAMTDALVGFEAARRGVTQGEAIQQLLREGWEL